jgi:hypothetical protein
MAKEINTRKITSYPPPRFHKMFKAYCDIHGHTDSKGVTEMIKFFFSQFSEHEQKKLIEYEIGG